MDGLTPPLLTAVREVRWMIASGRSMREAFRMYLESTNDALAAHLRQRWTLKWQSVSVPKDLPAFKSPLQCAFWELVERGCAGQPILAPLTALEEEIERAAQAELDLHLATLPFKTLIPLLMFQFPAYLVVLLGPILRELGETMGR